MKPENKMPLNRLPNTDIRESDQKQDVALDLLPIPALIQRAQAAFRRDLPELMRRHYRQWVAYHGDQRIGFGRSKFKLVTECLKLGLKDDEFLVRGIAPEMPDDDERLV